MENWKFITVVNKEIDQTWSTWSESDQEALAEASFIFNHGTGWSVNKNIQSAGLRN